MKSCYLLAGALVLGGSVLVAAEPALPSVPAALKPLQAKIEQGHWALNQGTVLSFRADQPLIEEQWKAIQGLGVKLIATGGKGIDDAAIGRLATLDPTGLSLDGGELMDKGFKHLAGLKSLRRLAIGHNAFGKKEFTGSGLALLRDVPTLEFLLYAGTSTGEEAMTAIGELAQLKEFSTWHTQQTDPRNLYLLKLTRLKSLFLGNSLPKYDGKPRQLSLNDSTITTIAQMKSLESLALMEARLTLSALAQLKALPNLKKLQLQTIDIPAEDVDKLRTALPGVAIAWQPLTAEQRKHLNTFLKDG